MKGEKAVRRLAAGEPDALDAVSAAYTPHCLGHRTDHVYLECLDRKGSDGGCGYGTAVAGLSGAAEGESVLYCLLGHQFDPGGISVCWFDTQCHHLGFRTAP